MATNDICNELSKELHLDDTMEKSKIDDMIGF